MARPSLSDLWDHRLSRRMLLLRSRGAARRRSRGAARRRGRGQTPSTSTSAPSYVTISVYLAKGYLLSRFGYEERQDLMNRGKEVDDFSIHHISPVPEDPGFHYLDRNFMLKQKNVDDSLLEGIRRDWYAIVKPKIKDPTKESHDPDLFFVNGELQKHARTVPQFSNGEEAVRFCLAKFSELDVRNKFRSLGNINSTVYADKNGCQWKGVSHDDLKRRLSSLFTIAPRVRVFKTDRRIFVHEVVFFFNVKTGALVNPDVVLPDDSKWIDIMWGNKETVFDAKTTIYV